MARWAPLKQDTLDSLASEISHNYGDGFALIAVTGGGAPAFAADLAASFGERDVRVVDLDGPELPARADGGILYLITGAATANAQAFNYTIWLEDRAVLDRSTRAGASAIVDVTDPEHPRRVFADSC